MKELDRSKYIDVYTVREEFSKFKLANGLTYKLKIPLIALKENTHEKGDHCCTINASTITGVLYHVDMPPNFDTSDLQTIDSTRKPEATKKLRIIQRHEVANIYETDNHFIILDVNLEEIFATNTKDPDGHPLLQHTCTVSTNFVEKSTHDNPSAS